MISKTKTKNMAAVLITSERSSLVSARQSSLKALKIFDIGAGDTVGAVSGVGVEFVGIRELSLCYPGLDGADGNRQSPGCILGGDHIFNHTTIIRRVRRASREQAFWFYLSTLFPYAA